MKKNVILPIGIFLELLGSAEYFHGDNGAGLGASHQTGWTGVIARTLDSFARVTPEKVLETSKDDLVARMTREQVVGA